MARTGTWLFGCAALLGGLAFGPTEPAHAGDSGKISCSITENGESASGTLIVLKGDEEVHNGACSSGCSLPAGEYTAVLGLDGALDGPEHRPSLTVGAGATASVDRDFSTGLLKVRIESAGRRAAGMAIIRRDGRQIGTLGSGVAAHLSAGTYDIVARYRTQQKAFEAVSIEQGQTRVLEANFE